MANLRVPGLGRMALLVLCVATLCSTASDSAAQVATVPDGVANCVWLRVKAKGSGYEVLEDGSALGAKRSISTDCYMQLVFMAPTEGNPHGRYGAPLLCPVNADEWEASVMEASFSGKAYGDGKVLAEDNYLGFTNAGGDVLEGWGTHLLQITVDKNTHAFKKAVFQTLGAETIDDSTFFESFRLVKGGYVAKGTSVSATSVPLPAKALVTGGPCPD